jgi:transcriptional regulator with XRE-family HTH domain
MADAQERAEAVSEHEKLGARLRAARDYLGLSQELVAQHLDVPRPAISAMERGTRKVSSVELKKLARLYGKPVAFFLGEETDPVLEADEVSAALFRATRQLNDSDRQQVLQFAEFLRHSGPAPRGTG